MLTQNPGDTIPKIHCYKSLMVTLAIWISVNFWQTWGMNMGWNPNWIRSFLFWVSFRNMISYGILLWLCLQYDMPFALMASFDPILVTYSAVNWSSVSSKDDDQQRKWKMRPYYRAKATKYHWLQMTCIHVWIIQNKRNWNITAFSLL